MSAAVKIQGPRHGGSVRPAGCGSGTLGVAADGARCGLLIVRRLARLQFVSVQSALLDLAVTAGGSDADEWLNWVVFGGPMPVPTVGLDITWPPGVVPA